MFNIRYGTFETNSSSVHSLMIATDEVYQQLVAGKLYIDAYHDEYLNKEEVINILLNETNPENLDYFWHNDLERETEFIPTKEWFSNLSINDLNEFVRSFCDSIYSFEDYGENYEWYDTDYTSEHGDKIHIFGYYGNDY